MKTENASPKGSREPEPNDEFGEAFKSPAKSYRHETLARELLASTERDRVRLSQLTWALSEALRSYEAGTVSYSTVDDALFALCMARV